MALLRRSGWSGAIAAALLLLAGCSTGQINGSGAGESPPSAESAEPSATPPVTATPSQPPIDPPASPAPDPPDAQPVVSRIGERQWQRIVDTGTWRPECPAGRDDLRRLEVNHRTFDDTVRRGVIVAHRDSVQDLAEVFSILYARGFPIERMVPVERYGGEVNASSRANNTSAFNCRRPGQINAPVLDSPHANGRAVDINPVQNPWQDPRCRCWMPSAQYAEVASGPGVIREGSLPVRLFESRGWIWQNISVLDYMHFDTGYPSRPRQG